MFPKGKNTKSKKKPKVHLVFDEAKRRDFLTGFHKRKMERKKKAQEKFEKQLKEEKKRLKAEARQSYKNLIKSYMPIPEVEHLLTEEYEDEDVNVKITELSTATSDRIGTNQPHYESDDNDKTEEVENENESEDELPGMEFDCKPSKTEKAVEKETTEEEASMSKAEIKKMLKKKATKNVQKSKLFRKKNKIERNKQKRLSVEHKKLKSKHKTGKRKKGRDL